MGKLSDDIEVDQVIPSIWYTVNEKQPENNGYFLSFKGAWEQDQFDSVGYYYFENGLWFNNARDRSMALNIIYWTSADPFQWYKQIKGAWLYKPIPDKIEMHPTIKKAWADLEIAIEKFETLKRLTDSNY